MKCFCIHVCVCTILLKNDHVSMETSGIYLTHPLPTLYKLCVILSCGTGVHVSYSAWWLHWWLWTPAQIVAYFWRSHRWPTEHNMLTVPCFIITNSGHCYFFFATDLQACISTFRFRASTLENSLPCPPPPNLPSLPRVPPPPSLTSSEIWCDTTSSLVCTYIHVYTHCSQHWWVCLWHVCTCVWAWN